MGATSQLEMSLTIEMPHFQLEQFARVFDDERLNALMNVIHRRTGAKLNVLQVFSITGQPPSSPLQFSDGVRAM